MNRKHKDFKKLQEEWYFKLKQSGFNDLENKNGRLRTDSMQNITTFYDQSSFEVKEFYFRKAGYFLNTYKFENDLDKVVWELFCNGESLTDIVRILKSRGYHKTTRIYKDKIHIIIKRLKKIMDNMSYDD